MKDALGNEIKIGDTYGYSYQSSGIITVGVGVATKLTESRVTLDIEYKTRGYSTSEPTIDESKCKTSVSGRILFPINKNK